MKYILSILLFISTQLFAQQATPPAIFSTGSQGLTYNQMASELVRSCQSTSATKWHVAASSGSEENVDCILNNKCNLSIVQADVLTVLAQGNSNVKVFQSLHPEEVHLIVLSQVKKVGGVMGIGAKTIPFNESLDLEKQKVGVWGGSVITANIINDKAGSDFIVVEFNDQKSALAALDKRDIDAILTVGGSRIKWIEGLDQTYKLIPFSDDHIKSLNKVYNVAKVSYRNLRQNNVKTISVPAVIITRNYTTGNVYKALVELKACFADKLKDLESTAGNHAKWADVKLPGMDDYAEPKWPMWEAVPTKATVKK